MTMKRETTAGIFFVFLILVSGRPAAAQMDTNPGRLTSDYLFRKFKSADSDNNHIDTFDGHGQLQTGNKDLVSELVSVVTKLQDRVTQLERQSSEDKTLLKLLHQQQQSGGAQGTKDGRQSSDAIGRLEAQMTSLKSDLSELVASKERDVERSEDIRELRLEFDGVNSECQKLRMEVQSLKDRREEDVKRYGQQRNSQMTIKWLQKTMQEVRKEMTELAAVQNVSAAIRQQQQYETGLSLLRSDVVALRTQVEECRVSQDRDQAALIQVQQDVQDLRNQHHTMAANAQLFREEVRARLFYFVIVTLSVSLTIARNGQVGHSSIN